MADGELTLHIDADLAARLKSAAEANGESVEAYAKHALEVFADNGADWAEDDRIAAETIANGDGIPLEDVLP